MARTIVLLGLLGATVATAAAASEPVVTVDTSVVGATLSARVLGVNSGTWFGQWRKGLAAGMTASGVKATRWPGGSYGDLYHYSTNTACQGAYLDPNTTFDSFYLDVVKPTKLDLAITLNYGTNAACNGGGDPNEAAAWVAHAKAKGYPVGHWTVGNEIFGWWEPDQHAVAHDAATYASAVANGYYPAIKAVDPKAEVGIVVNAQDPYVQPGWDPIVLANARYDFVEYHWYPQSSGSENDNFLLTQAPGELGAHLAQIETELAAAGRAKTPIFVGEFNSVVTNPGKQSMSITQALFVGEALGVLMQHGVQSADWWLGHGDCRDPSGGGNYSASLYGWQNFGGFQIISDGLPEYGCEQAPFVAINTALPTAQAYKLMSVVALDGEHMYGATISGTTQAKLSAFAMSHLGGEAVVLFNLDQTNPMTVKVAVPGVGSSSEVTTHSYDRAAYDQSKNNVWAGTKTQVLGARTLPMSLTLTPWSMTVVTMK